MKTKVPFASRCLLLCVVVMAVSIVLACRLVELQVVDAGNHRAIAADELIDKERIPAQRGIIMDRNEVILTNNILHAELVADRYHLREVTAVIEGLAYNQAVHDPRWEEKPDAASRRKLVQKMRSKLNKNALRDLSIEEKAELRRQIDPTDARANRLLEYDPEVCAYYFRLHDQLVAEVLYPFLSHVEVSDPAPKPQAESRGRQRAEEKPTPRKRYMTREDIIEKIAQTATEEYNREARAKGEPMRSFRNRIIMARGLNIETAEKIKKALKEAHINGLVVQTGQRRSYVMPKLLCHVLGYVDHENKGMSGVEAYFQSYLAGVDGMREYRHNARGLVLPNEDDRYMAPKHGLNLKLTIDMRLQSICEQELDRGMLHYRAKRGCMIVVEPHTGDILAMVSRPAFNLMTKKLILPSGEQEKQKGQQITGDFNFACQTRYEPGSTFKVIAVTAAVDKGIKSIHSPVSADWFSVGNSSMITDRPYHYSGLTVATTLKKSSNPAAARIALACKWPVFKEYLQRFGVTRSTGIELPSGGACIVSDGTNIVNFSRMAYGYSISVSPLHMAMVYAAIANKGVRMKPRLIDKIIAADGSIYDECKPVEVKRVMSPRTAADLCAALEGVTQMTGPAGRGTATRACIPGFRIGGKTGTAKKVRQGGRGGYAEGLYTVSFAGVLPINDPKLVVMTVIDEPHPTDCNPGGGTVAAPIFRAAAERMIHVLNLPPSDPQAYEQYLSQQRAQAAR